MQKKKMPLEDLLVAYAASRECSAAYRNSLARTLRKAGSVGLLSVADLAPPLVNKFLASLSSRSSVTRANIRRELLTLWRYAFEERLTEEPPLRVMKIKARGKAPQAWSMDELGRMLDCAESDKTFIGGMVDMRICEYLPAWILIAYDSGIRFADVHSLRVDEIRNGFVCKVAAKTGKSLVRPLSPEAIKLAQALIARSPDGSLFQWFLTRRRAFVAMKGFVDRHGFRGSSKYLRRSCATYIEATRPGEASRYLQHSQPNLVARHYLDESLLAVPSGPPPIRRRA